MQSCLLLPNLTKPHLKTLRPTPSTLTLLLATLQDFSLADSSNAISQMLELGLADDVNMEEVLNVPHEENGPILKECLPLSHKELTQAAKPSL